MCTTCGCSDGAHTTVSDPETGEHEHVLADGTVVRHTHGHSHGSGHGDAHVHAHSHSDGEAHQLAGSANSGEGQHHEHSHEPRVVEIGVDALRSPARTSEMIELERAVLAKNDLLAERNRGFFAGRQALALNVMSSPGSGKTTLLVRSLKDLREYYPVQVIEGDQETLADAERIRATGARVVQINTGTGCHLEADMVARGLARLDPDPGALIFIENVGNLVCPALFDLGEHARVVLFSITEGEDKPLKYPHMFRTADLVLLTKIDLLPHLSFDLDSCKRNVAQVAPNAQILEVSSTNGDGLDGWYRWIESRHPRRVPHTEQAHG